METSLPVYFCEISNKYLTYYDLLWQDVDTDTTYFENYHSKAMFSYASLKRDVWDACVRDFFDCTEQVEGVQ